MLMLKDNNLLLWFATFALIAVVSCGVGIGGELIEENNTKSKDSFENKTTYKKKKWFNMHIPQELRIRSRGTERHSASN